MQREIDWFKGKPLESWNTYDQASATLSRGQLRRSRELFERARALALQQGLKEQAASIAADQARFEADMGNGREARELADLAVRMVPNSAEIKAVVALAVARAADFQRAGTLANQVSKQPFLGTELKFEIFPCIRAAMASGRGKPSAAVEQLRPAGPYDLGTVADGVAMYYRGSAYLELQFGKEAAAQFQEVLNNQGIVPTSIYWPLAHLGLARAYAMTGDDDKSLSQYREFLTLWKNADPDLRILKQAQAEYATLSKPTP